MGHVGRSQRNGHPGEGLMPASPSSALKRSPRHPKPAECRSRPSGSPSSAMGVWGVRLPPRQSSESHSGTGWEGLQAMETGFSPVRRYPI